MSYLECKNINKHFGAVIAQKDATLSFEKGEIHAILGGNGSGKSTLARIVGGSLFPDRGEIFIEGKKVPINSPVKAKQAGIAVTSQELSLFNYLTVEDNLALLDEPAYLRMLRSPKRASDKAYDVLRRLGLENTLKKS